MPTSLADSFAHALGLLSIDGKPNVNLHTEAGKELTAQLLSQSVQSYHRLDNMHPHYDLVPDFADFNSRFLPAFADLFISSSFGPGEGELIYLARTWLLGVGAAPAFGRFLRERPDAYKALFHVQLARLTSNEGYWNPQLLYAAGMDAHIHRDHFGALLTIVSQLMAFAGYHGPTASFFGVTPEVAQKVRLLYVFLIESRPPKARDADIEELPLSLRKLDGIARYLHSGSVATRLDIPPSYKYWKRCEASVLPGVDACVKVPAGKEMACCAKCLSVRYCSPAHQKAHWKTHKPVCFKPTW